MRKPRIIRTWLGGLVAIGVGVLVLLAGLGLMVESPQPLATSASGALVP